MRIDRGLVGLVHGLRRSEASLTRGTKGPRSDDCGDGPRVRRGWSRTDAPFLGNTLREFPIPTGTQGNPRSRVTSRQPSSMDGRM